MSASWICRLRGLTSIVFLTSLLGCAADEPGSAGDTEDTEEMFADDGDTPEALMNAQGVAAGGRFLDSCRSSTISVEPKSHKGPAKLKITAQCANRTGTKMVQSEIDLNAIIHNENGKLAWGPSDYMATCSGCFFLQGTLLCTCRTIDGKGQSSQLTLNDGIANIDGKLTFAP